MKILGRSQKPLKYSSASTRFASLHGFMGGAEFNEVNAQPKPRPDEIPNDYWASNIRSGVNQRDCPSKFGDEIGIKKIASRVFMPDSDMAGWIRNKGEPVK